MPVTATHRDLDSLTFSITAAYRAPIARVWQLWADPRQLERWWGPPQYPATFVEHDLTPGARAAYYMTSPEGERYPGWWRIEAVDPPHALDFQDGFADDAGQNNPDLPVTKTKVRLVEEAGTTTMSITTVFPSREAMEQVLAMGMEEGITAAMGQIDAFL
jgi:uncharacterized protein YndB with AHSA1/START domain